MLTNIEITLEEERRQAKLEGRQEGWLEGKREITRKMLRRGATTRPAVFVAYIPQTVMVRPPCWRSSVAKAHLIGEGVDQPGLAARQVPGQVEGVGGKDLPGLLRVLGVEISGIHHRQLLPPWRSAL